MIAIKQMSRADVGKIAEIDRSEHVTTGYFVRDGELHAESVDWHVPPWDPQGDGEHSVRRRIAGVTRLLDDGGVLFGAFDGELLVGCAGIRYNVTETTAELAAMWVSRDYRRQGVATRLIARVVLLAQESGAKELYVSATPSESAVGFYTSQGFRPAAPAEVIDELYAREPEDVHMIKELEPVASHLPGEGGTRCLLA